MNGEASACFPVNREVEPNYLPMCRTYGLGVVPWSPLAGGVLTGKYGRGEAPPDGTRAADDPGYADRYLREAAFDVVEAVDAVAEEVEASPAQVSLAWLMRHPDVTSPIVGARTVEQLEENLGAGDVSLSDDQFDRLAAAATAPEV